MDIQTVMARLQDVIGKAGENTMNAMSSDLTNPENMLRVQYAVQMYAQMIQLQGSLTKKLDDMITGVIAKI